MLSLHTPKKILFAIIPITILGISLALISISKTFESDASYASSIDFSASAFLASNNNRIYDGAKTIYTTAEANKIEEYYQFYKNAADSTNVPWALLAVFHNLENGFSRTNPSSDTGIFGQQGSYTSGATVSDSEFVSQAKTAANQLKELNPSLSASASDDIIKKTFFKWNSQATAYITQAKSLGFSDTAAQNGEGSPYVMNYADSQRDPRKNKTGWGQIKDNSGTLSYPANESFIGAFIQYKALMKATNPVTITLNFNANNGTNPPAAMSCTTTEGQCSFTIPTTKPTRSDHTFIGWAETADAHSPSITLENIKNNYKISISQNKTLYAIWSPSHTLSFDLKGGTGSVPAQTCTNPESTSDGECSVTIPDTIPKRDSYKFLGYVEDENSKNSPLYLPGSQFNFTYECIAPTEGGGCYANIPKNKTLYAVWAKGEISYISNQTYTTGSDQNLVIKIDYPSSLFYKAAVDNNDIKLNNDFTIESGSTIITLSHNYLDTLSAGEHTLKATFIAYDGEVSTEAKFTIQKASGNTSNSLVNDAISSPDTGEGIGSSNDTLTIISYTIPVAIILVGISVYIWNRNRLRNKVHF